MNNGEILPKHGLLISETITLSTFILPMSLILLTSQFLSQLFLLIRCVLSLSQHFLNNTECKRSWVRFPVATKYFLILYC